ncbi:MAG: LysM peptidoglycan-binding domain-containing protein [Deltaproteobacteria bacterium]|nr:LysM peptidoglycan-binding domain-containing protein [Deltaproteobacteria bacterium]
MQNAYIDRDLEGLGALKDIFYAKVKKTQKLTVQGKENRLERLRKEIELKKQQIQKQGEDTTFEIYPTIYVVKEGDTLPSIAARHEIYNDSYMWPLIYKANRDQIKDPQIIYPGQDLKVPRDMSIEEIIGARREAGAPEPEKLPKDAFMPRR